MPEKKDCARLRKEQEKWEEETYEAFVRKHKERRPKFKTLSQDEIKNLYTPCDLEGQDYLESLGFPGAYPFTRGIQPNMYRGRLWTMRQYAGFGSADETNRRFKYLLEKGQKGLSVAFDLPTQIGYDSDHALARGEIGRVGVAIDSLEDMERLFDGIPLDKISTSMTINSTATILLAMYIAVGEKQGVPAGDLRGTVQNDILKEYFARGTYIYPPEASLRLVTNIFAFCRDHVPLWNTISVSGYHIREAGSSAVQEVAFTLADAITYVEAAIKAGLEVDAFAPRLSFFFNVHNHLLEEVAKFRAARRLWARLMRDRFKARDPRSMLLRFHTQTAGSALTAQQPFNNVVRVALQALSAVLGGTQSLHTNSMDEALSLPSERSVKVALRTQQLIAHESGVTDTVDPLAGAYAIEAMTDRIEKAAEAYIGKIDGMGGMLKAIEQGYVHQEIQESAFRYQKEIESRESIIVGVNAFMDEEETALTLFKLDEAAARTQQKRLKELKEKRDGAAVDRALQEVREAAVGETNVMPSIIRAVKTYATLGEIADIFRDVFGEFKDVSKF